MRPIHPSTLAVSRWPEAETEGCELADSRLDRRLETLVSQLSEGMGQPIPLACQDWAGTKAAYRFFANPRVREQAILEGHFKATRDRLRAKSGLMLVLQDTTEFSFHRKHEEAIGFIGHMKDRRVCGLLMHSSLAVTPEGLPLGIGAIKFWTRKQFKGTNALKRSINPTRVPIEEKESYRWLENMRQSTRLFEQAERLVHIGDRESDIYELFCEAQELGTHFLVRTCVDRLAGDGGHTIADEMQEVPCRGLHKIEVRSKTGAMSEATLELKYRRIRVLPPIGKSKQYPELTLTVLHATERNPPKGRERIDWKLITDLPVGSRAEAIEKLRWYAMRWKIETFHMILKSGCRTEESKLRTAERLVNLIAVYCILSWRIFWLTMVKRIAPTAPPSLALTPIEIGLLDELVKDRREVPQAQRDLSYYLNRLARLGGYLNRASDPPPGNKVMWRGMSRLTDIELGYELGAKFCG